MQWGVGEFNTLPDSKKVAYMCMCCIFAAYMSISPEFVIHMALLGVDGFSTQPIN